MILARYLGVSATALVIDYVILFALVWFGMSAPPAAACAYLGGAVVHFGLSRNFVFPRGWLFRRPGAEFVFFLGTGLLGTVITMTVIHLLVDHMGWILAVAKAIAVAVSFAVVYGVRARFVFRRTAGVTHQGVCARERPLER